MTDESPRPGDVAPDDVGAPSVVPEVTGAGAIARRSVWGLLAQFTPLAVNVVLTPYVIHGFGIQRYGLFMLVSGLTTLLGSFDGGLTAASQRYFSIFAGRDDKHETTRLLCTTVAFVAGLGAVIATGLWFGADAIIRQLHMPDSLRGEAAFMLRMAAAIIAVALLRNVPASILQANNRFAVTNVTYAVSYVIYTVGIVLSVSNHWGLQGAALTIAAQQLAATVVLVPASARYLTRSGIGFYHRAELRELTGFSFKMQAIGLANLFMAEVDSLIIAKVLPIANVTFYTAGSGFSEQMRTVPTNAIGPIQTALSHSYAEHGDAGLYPEFERLQRLWVLFVSGWCSAAIGAAYYGVTSWLGTSTESFHISGLVATVLLFGVFAFLGNRVLCTALSVAGFPGFQARMSGVMVVVNVTLTVALVQFGPLGVVAATAASQLAGAAYLERAVRRRHPIRMRNMLRDVPVVASVATMLTVFGLEWAIHPWVPHGALGLLASAVPALPGLAVYARLGLPADMRRRLMAGVRGRLRRGRAGG